MANPVQEILGRWPDRQSIRKDVAADFPGTDIVRVHRWFSRGRIPAQYFAALLKGARHRGLELTAEELIAAHGPARHRATASALATPDQASGDPHG